jgi:hypothetical protein
MFFQSVALSRAQDWNAAHSSGVGDVILAALSANAWALTACWRSSSCSLGVAVLHPTSSAGSSIRASNTAGLPRAIRFVARMRP